MPIHRRSETTISFFDQNSLELEEYVHVELTVSVHPYFSFHPILTERD